MILLPQFRLFVVILIFLEAEISCFFKTISPAVHFNLVLMNQDKQGFRSIGAIPQI